MTTAKIIKACQAKYLDLKMTGRLQRMAFTRDYGNVNDGRVAYIYNYHFAPCTRTNSEIKSFYLYLTPYLDGMSWRAFYRSYKRLVRIGEKAERRG